MTWLAAVPALGVAFVLLFAPGYLVARLLSLRGLWAWAFAPLASMSVIAIAALWSAAVGMAWSWLPVCLTALAVGLIAAVVRRFMRRDPGERDLGQPRSATLTAWVLAGAAILVGAQVVAVIGSPDNISQSFDNVFHLNAVRYVLETGSASPLTVGSMTSDNGGVWFYPSGWHASVALVSQLAGASIMTASNAMTVVVAAMVWPATVLLLTRTLMGRTRPVLIAAGALTGLIPAFPILMLDYGVLYPYLLGVALIPAALAAMIAMFGLHGERAVPPVLPLAVAVVGALPGIAVAHPGAFVAWMVLAMLTGVLAFVRFLARRPPRASMIRALIAMSAALIVAAVAWKVLKPAAEARGWPVEQSVAQAIGQAITVAPTYGNVPWVVVVLLAIGVVVAVRERRVPEVLALAALLTVGTLYVVASALPWHQLRDLMTAAWYNNAPRLAALLPLVVIPLAALGAAVLVRWLEHRLRTTGRRRSLIAVAAVAILLVIAGQAYASLQAIRMASAVYMYTDESRLITLDEKTLLERLPGEVPPGSTIVGSAWTGAGLAYAFSDRDVLMPHMLMDFTDDDLLILDRLAEARPGTAVCDAIERADVLYVLDFGTQEIHGAEHEYVGLVDLEDSSAVTLVDEVGDARLYRVTGCDVS
ncbi:hypothetical protein AUC47_02130 [Microbacterium sp. SZ1]|uniref:DUF6541 family protein n=1 Tax=Microbacterium sp. SZ1 TaxID=1849736 RepID=UPI000BBCE76D|nr:DUF6541 family protein [Microbacterium sp. SZ1]PCE14960.1 hypothetical protein AUC47_02130 [Microbacterium sp. SZ1]